MPFDPTNVSPEDIVETGGGRAFPFFQWVSRASGGTLAKGGFLWKADQSITADFTFNVATETVQIINGPELVGYPYKGLHAAILGVRQDWYYQNINEGPKKTFGGSYDEALALARGDAKNVKGRTQILALVKQLAPWYGPVVLTSSGVIGRAFDVLVKQEWPNRFIAVAGRLYNAPKLPLWMFWAPITTTGVEVRANPRYATTVVHPKLALPESITKEVVEKAYIGDALVAQVRALLPEVREWMAAKITANRGEQIVGGGSDGPDWGQPAQGAGGTSSGGSSGAQPRQTFQRNAATDDVPWE